MTTRRGFTLIELMITLVVFTVILAAIYQSMIGAQRATGVQIQRMDVQQSTRAATMYLSHALRELDAAEGDIAVAQAGVLRFRGMRWTGILCTAPVAVGGNVSAVIRGDLFFGVRGPDAAEDSVLLFRDNDPGTRSDDEWLIGGLISAGGGACTGGAPGTVLQIDINPASGGRDSALVGVTTGAPIRGFQMEELSPLTDAEGIWLGQSTANRAGTWSTPQPLLGPLAPNGLVFAYFDAAQAVTAVPTAVASIAVTVRGQSMAPVSGRGYLQDSIVTRIALRNNLRP